MEENEFETVNYDSPDPVLEIAQKNFGISYLYPWQRLVIENILDAERKFGTEEDSPSKQIVLLPTGAGKSLCFQIPALILDGPTLIIYPLLALMSDQERRMKQGGLDCVVFKGGQTEEERENNFERIKNGAKIIIANPEVLSNDTLLEKLCSLKIKHIAIDEAHCVSEWGDSFRPAYLELNRILKKLKVDVITAFTATASSEVLSRISQVLFDGHAHLVKSESDRPNIHYYVYKTESKKQAAILLAGTEQRPLIIFCSSRKRTEDLARDLNMVYGKDTAKFYHAGLEKEEKTKIEQWFFDQKNAVLCATCAYGMGVDKKDIRTVIHLDVPDSAEAYIQEAGRGGRDKELSKAILLWNTEDALKTCVYPKNSRKAVLRNFALTSNCRRQILLDAMGDNETVCSGCDLCLKRNKMIPDKRRITPAEKGDYNLVYRQVKRFNKFYTRETLETKSIFLLNKAFRPYTNANIWTSQDFNQIYTALIKERKIRELTWPWKNHIAVTRKKSIMKKRFLLLFHSFLRSFHRKSLQA